MRCLAVCHTELAVKLLDTVLAPGFDVSYVVESRPLARRLQETGLAVEVGDPRRVDTYVKAGLDPATLVVVEDTGRAAIKKALASILTAGGTLVYVLGIGPGLDERRDEQLRAQFPDVTYLVLNELVGGPLLTEFNRSVTKARVQQYQRYFSDADRVLILLHNDPDPDAMASGLALRNLLRRTKATAILGTFQPVSRPENVRMVNLLDIQVETLKAASLEQFDRIALVDVQPAYFGEMLHRVDLVIDHHPQQPSLPAVFKDIRVDYGSTSTILTEHLRAVDVNISERTATALLYAIKSDTLFFNRQANRVDLEAFSFLYPLADAALIRKMEGADLTQERLEFVQRAFQTGRMAEQVYGAFLGAVPREDLVPYVADFYLQLEDVKWTIVGGLCHDTVVVSVRNLGYSRNAGELVRRWFADIGSAGGHRSMAKAVMPAAAFRDRFGALSEAAVSQKLLDLALDFLHGHQPQDRRRDTAKGT